MSSSKSRFNTERRRRTRAPRLRLKATDRRLDSEDSADCSGETRSLSVNQQPRRQQALPSATRHEHWSDELATHGLAMRAVTLIQGVWPRIL